MLSWNVTRQLKGSQWNYIFNFFNFTFLKLKKMRKKYNMAEKDQAKVFCYIRGIVLTILSRALSFSRSCLKYLRIEFYCFLNFYKREWARSFSLDFYEIILDLYFSEIRACMKFSKLCRKSCFQSHALQKL